MIRSQDELRAELSIEEGFEVRITDRRTIVIDGTFDSSELIAEVKNMNLDPDDVFDTADLETWAEDNGFTRED